MNAIEELPCGGDHAAHEDCMICCECGTCSESLNDEDLCGDCAPKSRNFKYCLRCCNQATEFEPVNSKGLCEYCARLTPEWLVEICYQTKSGTPSSYKDCITAKTEDLAADIAKENLLKDKRRSVMKVDAVTVENYYQ